MAHQRTCTALQIIRGLQIAARVLLLLKHTRVAGCNLTLLTNSEQQAAAPQLQGRPRLHQRVASQPKLLQLAVKLPAPAE